MITHLRGKLFAKKPPYLIIDVAGIGYEVQASMNTIHKLPEEQKEIFLYTYLVVREDAQILYGFYDEKERSLFKEIIKTSGVGPKLALAILSGMDVEAFCRCVKEKEVSKLIGLPGVGKKTAERLVMEMHDRLSKNLAQFMNFDEILIQPESKFNHTAVKDAVSALVSLGYRPSEADKIVSKIAAKNATDSETLIRLSLKELAR